MQHRLLTAGYGTAANSTHFSFEKDTCALKKNCVSQTYGEKPLRGLG